MAVIRCKMCGGDVELTPDKTFGTCEFCGNTMTFPKVDDDQRAAAFNRGNHFRRIGEFDKALAVYERIVQEDDTDAEAHWCCALCRFGIEYVEDPATFEWLPTCHRASFDSFLEDVDYLAAVQHSDGITRRQYQKDAAKIAEVQRGILATSQNEEPFDVFLCYKETDENGNRTRDSLMAQDVYYQLTEQGYRVFFSRITLEDMAGREYEPYIFAALNSAKVMIVIGTRPEYMNAVWVKNEWSRFLALMKRDRHKVLLPCYRDMDPYDMPEQLSVLQSYDMGKIGFLQDLVRGIHKVLDTENRTEQTQPAAQTGTGANTAALLRRVFMFLEDGDWQSADEYCEKVLDQEPENAQAYLGKLMASVHAKTLPALEQCAKPFDGNNHYLKVTRFGDAALIAQLKGYLQTIRQRNELERQKSIYGNACALMKANQPEKYREAAEKFASLAGYKDAAAKADQCRELAESSQKDRTHSKAVALMEKGGKADCQKAIKLFESISGWKNTDALVATCRDRIAQIEEQEEAARLDAIYADARSKMATGGTANYEAAIALFQTISNWKDSKEKIAYCRQTIEDIQQQLEQERIDREKRKERIKKQMILGASVVAAIAVLIVIVITVIIPAFKYNSAKELMDKGEYEAAVEGFAELNFMDSYDQYCTAFTKLKDSYCEKAEQYLASGDKVNAAIWYRKAGNIDMANSIFNIESLVYAGEYISAGIMMDGTLRYQSNYEYDRDNAQADLRGITAFLQNNRGIAGVDNKGFLLTHSLGAFDRVEISDEMDIESYHQIVSILHGISHPQKETVYYVVMLLEDGTVVEALESGGDPFPELKNWKNIKSIQSGAYCIFGIDQNGNVYQAMEVGGDPVAYNVSELTNVCRLVPFSDNLIVLTKDGEVTVLGETSYLTRELSGKDNVQDVCYCNGGVLVLYRDGTVELITKQSTSQTYGEIINKYYETIFKELETWRGVVSVQPGGSGIIGIRYDGTVNYVSTDIYYGSYSEEYHYTDHEEFATELEAWTNVVYIAAASNATEYARNSSSNWAYAIGIKYDGSAVSTGKGTYYTAEEGSNGNYYYNSHEGGNYHIVTNWKFW